MKIIKDNLDGNCKHGILRKEYCQKCWDKLAEQSRKETIKFLKALEKASKNAANSKLFFDIKV